MTTESNIFKDPGSFHEQLQAIQPSVEASFETKPETQSEPEVVEQHEELVEQDNEVAEEQTASEETPAESSDEKPKKENKYVPRSRLNELSEKKAALEVQVQKEREDRIRLEERLSAFMSQKQEEQTRNVTPELNLDNIDPLDLDTHNIYKREIKALRDEVAKVKVEAQRNTEMTYLNNAAQIYENEFKKEHTDYSAALNHLAEVEIYDAELEHGQDSNAKQIAAQKLLKIAEKAIKEGKNSAETLYNMAVKKGFRAENASKSSESVKKGSNLEAISKNMDKSASISSLGTGATMSPNSHSFDLAKMRVDPKNPKSKLDPDKFHNALKQIH